MDATADAVMTVQGPRSQAASRGPGSAAAVLDRLDPVAPPSTPSLDLQLQELQATIDARLAKYRRREWLSRVIPVRAYLGVSLAVWLLGASLL